MNSTLKQALEIALSLALAASLIVTASCVFGAP